jgi:FAD/FMN-containing dehydrogenase
VTVVREYRAWGYTPPGPAATVVPLTWRSEPPPLTDLPGTVLPFGYGRSYGDSCLNPGGALLDMAPLDRFIEFDAASGRLRCEAGVTFAEILRLMVPRGWFLPVVPGTKWVSLGGAIANDIHGKNHHRAGTFGRHVLRFELLRSTGERLLCAPDEHASLFRATVGGLGLTGVILWAEVQLTRVPGPMIALERIRYRALDEFFELCAADSEFEYTVAWVDCLRRREPIGRGIFMRGDHVGTTACSRDRHRDEPAIRLPFAPRRSLLSRPAMRAFNGVYYRAQLRRTERRTVAYDPFFFPLDAVGNWNRLYGPPGLVQYQCVVPDPVVRTLLQEVTRSSEGCYLAVLKKFGDVPSPGLLSFPRAGVTLALDFAFRGRPTFDLLERLDTIVAEAGGAVYPAKDVRMSGPNFRRFFPEWEAFATQVDPKFSSSFWRRVTRS